MIGNSACPFVGQLAEVRVWGRVRSQAEIQSAMGRRLVGCEEGLLGYWKLDDAPGAVLRDSTSGASAWQSRGQLRQRRRSAPDRGAARAGDQRHPRRQGGCLRDQARRQRAVHRQAVRVRGHHRLRRRDRARLGRLEELSPCPSRSTTPRFWRARPRSSPTTRIPLASSSALATAPRRSAPSRQCRPSPGLVTSTSSASRSLALCSSIASCSTG